MFHHPGEINPLHYKPVSPTRASYSRGVCKTPKPENRQISLRFPNTTADKAPNIGNRFIDDDVILSPRVHQNNVTLLRSRRWSNPDIGAKEKKQRERFQNGGLKTNFTSIKPAIVGGGSKNGGGLDLYDFYINKVNTNNYIIQHERDKRLGGDSSQSKQEKKQLRKGYVFHTSSTGTQSKILEWMQEESKWRRQYWEYKGRIRSRNGDYPSPSRPSFSAHPLSRVSVHLPPDPENTLTRKESFVMKLTRRPSLWQQPKAFKLSRKEKVRNFKWYGTVIRSICGLKMEMQILSISKTQQSNVSEFMYISAGASTIPVPPGQDGPDEGQHLLFDKSLFSRTRATSHMPPWAINLMTEPPTRRPDDQVHHLKQLLMGMKSFRENITEDLRHTVAKVVRYTKCDKGRVVLRQGHWGFDFYFIYSGSVFIQLELTDKKTGQTYPSVENVLKSGEGFGEIALLGDGKRTASVICKEPTELCQIDKETFLEICPAMYNELLEQKIEFARQFPIFHFWDAATLKKLCFLSQVLDIPHSTIIEQDWSQSNFAYFVMKGQIKMVKPFNATNIDNASSQERALGNVDGPNRSKGRKSVVYTKNAHVGVLTQGMNTDLSVLSLEPRKDIANIILVSEGVRVLRVSARTFMWVSPRKGVEEYLKKVYKHPTFPSSEEMCARYHINISWSEFKKNVISTSRLEKAGQIISNIPATLKGTTGWAKWPGYRLRPRNKMNPTFAKDRLQSVSDDVSDDEDDVISDDLDTLASTESSVFLDDASMSHHSVGVSSSRRKSPVSKTIHTAEKVNNDRTMTIDPPVYRTAAHLRNGLNKQPLDARSV